MFSSKKKRIDDDEIMVERKPEGRKVEFEQNIMFEKLPEEKKPERLVKVEEEELDESDEEELPFEINSKPHNKTAINSPKNLINSSKSVQCVRTIPGKYSTIYEISVSQLEGYFLYTTQDKQVRLFKTSGKHVKTIEYSGSVKGGAIFQNYSICTSSGDCIIYEIPSLKEIMKFNICGPKKWFDDLIVMKSLQETFIACCYCWERKSDDEPQGIIYQVDNFTSSNPNIEIIYEQHDPIKKACELILPKCIGPRFVFTGSLTRTIKNKLGFHDSDGDFRVMILNIENPENIQTFGSLHTKEITSLKSYIKHTSSEEEEYVVSGDKRNVLGIWNASSGELIKHFDVTIGYHGKIGYLFTYDKTIFVGQKNHLLCFFSDEIDDDNGTIYILNEKKHVSGITSIKVLENGNVVSSDSGKMTFIWKVKDRSILERMDHQRVRTRLQSIKKNPPPKPDTRRIKRMSKGHKMDVDEVERLRIENVKLKRKVRRLKMILKDVDHERLKIFEMEEEKE